MLKEGLKQIKDMKYYEKYQNKKNNSYCHSIRMKTSANTNKENLIFSNFVKSSILLC